MRVAIFTDNDFSKVNGVTTTLKAVLRHAPLAWHPRVYTAGDAGTSTDTYFCASGVGAPIPWYRDMRIHVSRIAPFARELRRHGVDLVHVTTPGPIGLIGRHLARRFRVPVIGSYHTHFGEYTEALSGSARLGRLMNDYMRWFYGPSRVLLVPSTATRQMLIDQKYRAEHLKVWPRGVDTDQFSPARASVQVRRRWQVDERRLAIVYAGRLSAEKGLRLIAPIQRELYRRGVEHRFIFVGDGPMADDLRRDCPDGVFLGNVTQGQVAVAMASADLFLFPSATDSCGNVVLEAQASGLPVIVSDAGGPRHQMVADATGIVCPSGDVPSFVDAVVRLRHPIARRSMSVVARQHAISRDWPDALRPLYHTWRAAISQRASDVQPMALAGDAVGRS